MNTDMKFLSCKLNGQGALRSPSVSLCVSLLALLPFLTFAEDATTPPRLIVRPPGTAPAAGQSAEMETDGERKLRALEDKRREVSMKMHEARVRLIKETPELTELHKKIMSLHRSLANKLDKTPEMKQLLDEANKLDAEIATLLEASQDGKQSK